MLSGSNGMEANSTKEPYQTQTQSITTAGENVQTQHFVAMETFDLLRVAKSGSVQSDLIVSKLTVLIRELIEENRSDFNHARNFKVRVRDYLASTTSIA